MQYSIVTLKEIKEDNEIFRYDAEYFHPQALRVLSVLKKNKFKCIGEDFDVTKLAGFEYTSYFTESNMSSSDYYIALTSKNIQNEELNLKEYITIDRNVADENLKRSKLIKGDVILSYTGEYRRALTLFGNNYQLGPNICLIRNRNKELKATYLSTFLNSCLGQTMLDKEKTLSAQPTVAMSRIRKIPIPILSEKFQGIIDFCINLKYQELERSKIDYESSINFLLQELGISSYKCSQYRSYIKNYSDTYNANRLDAEYFQPKYDELIEKIKSYSNGWDVLENLVKLRDKNFSPKDETKYTYIELANINNNGSISDTALEIGKNLPTRARRIVKTGDVIVSSIEGSLNSIALITPQYDNALCSTGFYVMHSDEFNPETLFCLMKSVVSQMQLKKGCSGTILTAINNDELSKIILPRIDNETQNKIKEKISEMYESMQKSKQLLEIAKHGVEKAIEENEDIAMQWIDEQLNQIGVTL